MTKTPQDWLTLLHELADVADDIGLHYFKKAQSMTLGVDEKENRTPVSEGDLAIEKEVRQILDTKVPGLAVLGEEFGSCDENERVKLIIDPIDATSNFIRGIPFFASLLAIEVDKKIVAGVVSSPAKNDRWWASLGGGSFHNEQKLSVTMISELENAQAFHGGLYGNEARGNLDQLMNLLSKTRRQRGIGDYLIHVLVAMGCGEFALDFGLAPWDLAPLGILVEESGGKVTHVDGSEFSPYGGSILTSNGVIHQKVVEGYEGPELRGFIRGFIRGSFGKLDLTNIFRN